MFKHKREGVLQEFDRKTKRLLRKRVDNGTPIFPGPAITGWSEFELGKARAEKERVRLAREARERERAKRARGRKKRKRNSSKTKARKAA